MHNTIVIYANRMEWNLAELRCFVAAVETGTFTDAAIEIGISQAAVSRRIASLERAAGQQLVHRTRRGCTPTDAGQLVLAQTRRLLAEADRLSVQLSGAVTTLRLGYAWAALGVHTPALLRSWHNRHSSMMLHLVQHHSSSAGLAEGMADVAIIRNTVDEHIYDSATVGIERRMVAFATDDTHWERRRRISLAEVAERAVVIDPKAGTTDDQLWSHCTTQPKFLERSNVNTWLDAIAAGYGVGITSEATAYHHGRSGVSFRPVKDGPSLKVRLVWRRDDRPAGLGDLINDVTRLYGHAVGDSSAAAMG